MPRHTVIPSRVLIVISTVVVALVLLLASSVQASSDPADSGLDGPRLVTAEYKVRSGDTLYSIAWRYELDPFELAAWNNLSSPYIIRPGDRLHTKASDSKATPGTAPRSGTSRKPGSGSGATRPKASPTVSAPVNRAGSVTVQKGDTLYGLARRHGVSTHTLARANNLKKPYVIYPGQQLRLQSKVAVSSQKKPPSIGKTSTATQKNVKLVWQWPIKGMLIGKFNSKQNDAKGIDIAGTEGKPVKAAATGKVVYSGNGLISYGNLVIIKHNRSYLSAYAHNRKLLVKEGQQVKAGQTIAELGQTGTDSPRLHFEIRRNGKPVDPLKHLPSS